MRILSKMAPLETSIAQMESILENLGCGIVFSEEKHALTHCYSVNLASKEAPFHIYSNGKGTLSAASKASALGEYIERLQTNNFFTDFYLPSRPFYTDEIAFDMDGEYLNASLKAFYSEAGELRLNELVDFNSDYDDKIIALPFKKLTDNSDVYFPVNILNTLYVSNGLASGNTPNEAKVQALSEIFERYAKFEIIKHGYALPPFPESIIQAFPKLHADIAHLRKAGYLVDVLDASLGGQFPVTAISLINPTKGTLFVSFGSHPILEVSLSRTLSELMQGRDLQTLDSFEIPTLDMAVIEDTFNLESHFIDSNGKMGLSFLKKTKSFHYTPWRYMGESCEDEFAYLCEIVESLNKEIFLREYTYLGFYSCHMLVPGLCEIYPIEDLIYHNKNEGKWIRPMVLDFISHDPLDVLDAIDALEETLDMEKYIGVIFEKNFTMNLFKAQMHLLAGKLDETIILLENSEDLLHRVVCELIRFAQQELQWDEYKEAFDVVFTDERVSLAQKILEKKAYLIDTTFHQHYTDMLLLYDKLSLKKAA